MSSVSVFWRAAGFALLVFVVGIGAVKAAQDVTFLIKSRQDKLRDMGGALKGVSDELKKRDPSWAIIQPAASDLASRSKFLLNWFPKGTGPDSGKKTYALADIWPKGADFTKLGKAMMVETAKLDQIAQTKNADALRAQVIVVGKSCKACHKDFRSPDYEKENEDD